MLLEPGQSAQVEWDGGFFPSAQLPSGCSREQGCEYCYHRTVPEVASIWVKSVAFTECTQSDAGDCACLSGQSPCEVWADTLGGTPIEVTAEVDLGSSDAIEIRFD
jgi:hypothetical protein